MLGGVEKIEIQTSFERMLRDLAQRGRTNALEKRVGLDSIPGEDIYCSQVGECVLGERV